MRLPVHLSGCLGLGSQLTPRPLGRPKGTCLGPGSQRARHPPPPSRPQVGKAVRSKRVEADIPLDPFTAGVYIATMVAQVR